MVVVQSDESHEVREDSINDNRQRLRQRFQVVRKLGQGTYGKVQLAINKETKQEVAIKTIRKGKIENEQDLIRIRREIQIMSAMRHPHIIHIYEVLENCEKIVLVMQYASGGELYDYLGCHKKLPEKEARRIFRQIASAIYYCHKNKICHRDLKLENILLDEKGNAKIADFGLSNVFDDRSKLHTFCGSPLYASPEIVKGTPYCGPEVDCWSLGVLLYTLVYGAMPFDGSNFRKLVRQISEGDYYEPKLKSKASGIIRGLLTVNVDKRSTIKDICSDEWVNDTYDHSLLQVANDMASLTPVPTNALAVLAHRSELRHVTDNNMIFTNNVMQTKNKVLDPKSTTKFLQNELSNQHSHVDPTSFMTAMRNSDDLNHSGSTVPHSCEFENHESSITPTNSSPSLDSVIPDIVNHVDNGILSSCSQDAINKEGMLNGIKVDNTFHENTTMDDSPKINYNCDVPERNRKHSSLHDIIEPPKSNQGSIESQGIEYFSSLDLSNQNNIPKDDQEPLLKRRSTVEQFRAWRDNLDVSKQYDPDRILPIFDVTSTIPKRSNGNELENEQQKTPLDSQFTGVTNSENNIQTNGNILNLETEIPRIDSVSDNNEQNEVTLSKEGQEVTQFLEQRKLSNYTLTAVTSELNHKTLNTQSTMPDDTEACERPKNSLKPEGNVSNFDVSTNEECSLREIIQDRKEEIPESTDMKIASVLPNENRECYEINIFRDSDKNISVSLVEPEHINRDACEKHPLNSVQEKRNLASLQSPTITPKKTLVSSEHIKSPIQKPDRSGKSNDSKTAVAATKRAKKVPHYNKQQLDAVTAENLLASFNKMDQSQMKRQRQSRQSVRKLQTRSYSVDNDPMQGGLDSILRRPRKYSLCALLAASFELNRDRRDSQCNKRLPGKITIPKHFDPSSESESSTPLDKREFLLIPTISVAENKRKMENEIEKVKRSALSLKLRRNSEAGTRRKLKKYKRSFTDVLECNSNTMSLLQENGIGYNDIDNYPFSQFGYIGDDFTDNEMEYNYGSVHVLGQEEIQTIASEEMFEIPNSGYVPITRCCKKITFPPKSVQNMQREEAYRDEEAILNQYLNYYENALDEETRNTLTFEEFCEAAENMKLQHIKDTQSSLEAEINGASSCNANGEVMNIYENATNFQSTDSLNSNSIEKDSSDNDDDLDSMVIDSSGDLWKFLKRINNDASENTKIKRNAMNVVYSRSKSQDCRMADKVTGKSLTRSRSKEERKNRHTMLSHSSEETCESSSMSDVFQTPSGEMNLFQINNTCIADCKKQESIEEDSNSACLLHNKNRIKNPSRFYSLNNINAAHYDSSDMDADGNDLVPDYSKSQIIDGVRISDKRLLAKVLEFSQNNSLNESIKPYVQHAKTRSQSSAYLSDKSQNNIVRKQNKTLSYVTLKSDNAHSNTIRNKAFSDMDIYYNDPTRGLDNYGNVLSNQEARDFLRFSQSLGRKFNSELLSTTRQHPVAPRKKLKDNILNKKRNRKVSFVGDSMKDGQVGHTNFALESLAKAQMALNSIDRDVTDNESLDDKGTLLEALKTLGYNAIMSQRLQQSEDLDDKPINRRYSLACMRNMRKYENDDNDDMSFNYSNASAFMDPAEYVKQLQWRKHLMQPVEDISNDYNDLEYTDFLNLNSFYDNRMPSKTDTNWCKLPNLWLYQNTETLRPNHVHEDISGLPNWDESDSNLWQRDFKYEGQFNKSRSHNYYNADISEFGFNPNTEQVKYCFLDADHQYYRNTDIPHERLSARTNFSKQRCQPNSFDESLLMRRKRSESLENTDPVSTRTRSHGSAASLESPDEDKPEESVSDRIWRKSFYSRFNDTPSLRRRRSMLFDADVSQDPLLLSALRHSRTPDRTKLKDVTPRSLDREFDSPLPKERSDRKTPKVLKNCNSSSFCNDVYKQNIPYQTKDSPDGDIPTERYGNEEK